MTCGRRDDKDVAWSGQQWIIGKDPWEGDDEKGWYGDCEQSSPYSTKGNLRVLILDRR